MKFLKSDGISLPKKKEKDVKKKDIVQIQSLGGWKIGDITWAVMMGDTRPSQLEINRFHPKDTVAPALTGTCLVTGKSRTVAIEWCEDSKPAAKKNFEKRRAKSC